MEIDDAVVFVEVKTRAGSGFGGAVAAVGYAKQRRIRRLASEWLAANPGNHGALRFDVAAVTGTQIEVWEAAF